MHLLSPGSEDPHPLAAMSPLAAKVPHQYRNDIEYMRVETSQSMVAVMIGAPDIDVMHAWIWDWRDGVQLLVGALLSLNSLVYKLMNSFH